MPAPTDGRLPEVGAVSELSSPEPRKHLVLPQIMASKPVHAGPESRSLALPSAVPEDCVVTHAVRLLCTITVLRAREAKSII